MRHWFNRPLALLFAAAANVAVAPAAVVTTGTPLPAAIVQALERDTDVAECVKDQDDPAPAYLADGFNVESVVLTSGERIVFLVGNTGCLVRGSSSFVFAFRKMPDGGYRQVLKTVSTIERFEALPSGVVHTAGHETIDIFLQGTYVWNGSEYLFAPEQSTEYDVAVEQTIPYEVAVHFAPGTSSTTLSGIDAYGFGPSYAFAVRKGQRITVETTAFTRSVPSLSIWLDDKQIGDDSVAGRWSGIAPHDGTYHLDVFGTGNTKTQTGKYTIRLTIR